MLHVSLKTAQEQSLLQHQENVTQVQQQHQQQQKLQAQPQETTTKNGQSEIVIFG